jgi:transposase
LRTHYSWIRRTRSSGRRRKGCVRRHRPDKFQEYYPQPRSWGRSA